MSGGNNANECITTEPKNGTTTVVQDHEHKQ
jgi:hypothetical protein